MEEQTPVLGLEGYTPDVEYVRFKTKEGERVFSVRGLTTDDITYLVSKYRTDLEAGVLLYRKAQSSLVSTNKLDDLILMLLREAPGLVSEVISVASDQRHLVETIRTLPFSVQASAAHKIVGMTLVEADGLKNLMASLQSQVEKVLPLAMRKILATPKTSSPDSTGDSEQTSPS